MKDAIEAQVNDICRANKRVLSRFGYTIMCDEDRESEAIIVAEGCEDAQEAARKYGFTVLCDDGAPTGVRGLVKEA